MLTALVPHALAALLGARLARADERFRPMSRGLLALLGVHLGHYLCQLPRPDRAERIARFAAGLPVVPYEGAARASWAVEQALVLTWYVVLSWAVCRALAVLQQERQQQDRAIRAGPHEAAPERGDARSKPETHGRYLVRSLVHHGRTIGALSFLASSAALFFLYPAVRGRPVELASTVVFCAALTAQLAAATQYILRWRQPDAARGVALVLVAGSVADAAGPWLFASPARDWRAGEPVGVLIWLVTIGVELWVIARRRA
jgi:hypothetical protein